MDATLERVSMLCQSHPMDSNEVADRLEITDVITRYTRAIDTRAFDWLHTEVFTQDAVLDYSAVGAPVCRPDAVVEWVAKRMLGFDRYMHILGQVVNTFHRPANASTRHAASRFITECVGKCSAR